MFKLKRRCGIALFVAIGLMAAPAAAQAATLYATPSPLLGANCGAESPCALSTALTKAATGDTVVIGVGTYASGSEYSDGGKSLTIEGAAIGPGRPVIEGGFKLTGSGTRITDVQSTFMRIGNGAEADRVLSISNASDDGCEIESTGGTIANSVCATESSFFSGLSTQATGGPGPMIVRNDTMVGHNGFYSSSSGIVTIEDSIAMRNSTSSAVDASLGEEDTNLIRSYALNRTPDQLPKSEVEPLLEEPIFRGAGDYREAAGSPSIDFGSTTVEYGELDLDGNLRKIGAKSDLGAYEFVPDAPSFGTPSATRTSSTSATVNVPIDPNSGRTYYHVEYGPTVAYGSSTATLPLPAATTPATVEVDLTGLPADSTVHYKVVATSDGGGAATADASVALKTEEPVAKKEEPAKPSTPAAAQKLAPVLRFVGGKGGAPKGQPLLDRSAIKLSTGCGPVACGVTVSGTVKVGSKVLGTLPGPKAASHWQAGKQGAMKLRVSSKVQRLVRAYLEENPSAKAKILVTGTFTTAAGEKVTRKLTIPVRPI
jgi:hypothetical protein